MGGADIKTMLLVLMTMMMMTHSIGNDMLLISVIFITQSITMMETLMMMMMRLRGNGILLINGHLVGSTTRPTTTYQSDAEACTCRQHSAQYVAVERV